MQIKLELHGGFDTRHGEPNLQAVIQQWNAHGQYGQQHSDIHGGVHHLLRGET